MVNFKRTAGMVAASFVALSAGLFATSSPASAATRNISQWGVGAACNNSPYLLCLFYRGQLGGALWGTNTYVSNLSSARFGSGDGSGQVVRNAAASMSCDTTSLKCYSYVSPNKGGNIDVLNAGSAGQLYYTWNNEASVDVR
jgi:hypothetical protein